MKQVGKQQSWNALALLDDCQMSTDHGVQPFRRGHFRIRYPSSAVVVSATHDDSEFSISVVDQGQGLSEEDMGKAFNRFTRLSAMPTGGEESVGLGLANVRAVVERQGGAVRAESPGKDKGAVFSITLPIKVVTE